MCAKDGQIGYDVLMKSTFMTLSVMSFLWVACGGATTTIDDGGADASTGDSQVSGDTSTSDTSTGDTSTVDTGTPCNAQPVNLTFANCPAQPSCGGTIVDGSYDYTTGCIPTPWAQAQQNCQALKVTNETGTVTGCITFASGFATRQVQTSYGATLDVPTSCLLGGSCAQLQTLLSNYFTATCTASTAGCTCDVSGSYGATGGVSYTTSNNQLVTSTNNHYAYCVGTGAIDMQWASGPNAEPGVYTLTKQ